ncbi:MAG: aspartyl protease [Phycisphaerae bacterium]|nr:aspartyl protease [Phycisphaerae bacterium]
MEITVCKGPDTAEYRKVECMVDTGAVHTLLPREVLSSLVIEPLRTETFVLADGKPIQRPVGRAFVEFGDRGEYTRVIFGEPADGALLGVLTLEELLLAVDPLNRQLVPIQPRL